MKKDILKRALAGDRFTDLRIVDAHCHMGNYYNFYFSEAGIDEMIHDADILGVDRVCIAPHAAISCNFKLGNRQLLDAVQRYPHRVFGLLTLNPHKPEEIDGEFEKYYAAEQFIGVKIHPGLHNYPVNGENYTKVFDKVKQLGGFVLAHTWEGGATDGINMNEEVIRSYPEIPYILGHSGGTPEGVVNAIRVVNKYENAYLDTSGFEFSNTWIEEIAAKADNTKILFGSDYPFHDLRGGISRILFSDLDDDVKAGILSGNFRNMAAKHPKVTRQC